MSDEQEREEQNGIPQAKSLLARMKEGEEVSSGEVQQVVSGLGEEHPAWVARVSSVYHQRYSSPNTEPRKPGLNLGLGVEEVIGTTIRFLF